MGIFSSLFGGSDDGQEEDFVKEKTGPLPELYNGMTLEVESTEGQYILVGRLSGYRAGDSTLTIERLPGGLSMATREAGTPVLIRGVSESLIQFYLQGSVQESTRVMCRLKDVKVKSAPEQRHDFRLRMGAPATMYYRADEAFSHPEECILLDISIGGACIESEYLHAEDEVLRLKVKLLDYSPMEFIGEVIRVTEYKPGKFRYGILFAQLREWELTDLTRTLYNIQVGNRAPWMRSEEGDWVSGWPLDAE